MITVSGRPVGAIAADLAQIPQTISVNIHTGRYDIVCAVLARARAELGAVISATIPQIEGIAAVRCELAVDVLRFDSAWAALTAHTQDLPQPTLMPGAIDELDLRIIEALHPTALPPSSAPSANVATIKHVYTWVRLIPNHSPVTAG